MTHNGFNVLTDPWIGVTWIAGVSPRPKEVGIRELMLRSHEITDFHAPLPPAAAGLMRILIVLVAQATGLADAKSAPEWEQHRNTLLSASPAGFDAKACDRAFGPPEYFNVFGDRPFLQDPRLYEECSKSSGINKLIRTRVAGNNQVFLSHDRDDSPRPVGVPTAVWHLIAWLYYGASGRCTARTVSGVNEANVTAGPLRKSLSVHPWAANLYETLLVNQCYVPRSGVVDPAPWQRSEPNDSLAEPPTQSGIAWLLTGRFRHAIQLVPNSSRDMVVDAYITWAWRKPHAPTSDDPYLPMRISKEGTPFPYAASADRAIWRDLDSLIRDVPATTENKVIRPAILSELNSLPLELLDRLRIRVYGFDQDGQTRDKAYFQGSTPPILGALKREDTMDRIRRVHDAANNTGEKLRVTLRGVWRSLVGPKGAAPPVDAAMATYWTRAGELFWNRIRADSPNAVLPNEFIRLAVQVYESALDAYAVTPKAIRDIERHRTYLFHGWKKETPDERQHRSAAVETDTDERKPAGDSIDREDDLEW